AIGVGSFGSATSDWSIVGTGDFDGDGFGDILWYNAKAGPQIVVWLTNGTSVIGGGSRFAGFSPPVATGDFNGDGKTDIVWYDPSNGDVLIWLMDVATVIGSGVPGSMTTDWAMCGTGDFNGDGKSRRLWRNNTTRH